MRNVFLKAKKKSKSLFSPDLLYFASLLQNHGGFDWPPFAVNRLSSSPLVRIPPIRLLSALCLTLISRQKAEVSVTEANIAKAVISSSPVKASVMGEFSIQISSDLINRLADDNDKPKMRAKKTKAKKPRETKPTNNQLDANPELQKGTNSAGWPVQHPLYYPVTPPAHSVSTEVDAIQTLLQETENVVERLQEKEENMLREVTERAKDLRDKEFKLPYQKPMPCLAEHDACRACYKEHGIDPIKCSPLAQSYYNCARKVKQQGN